MDNWWAKGPTPAGCNVLQNDLAQMASVVGWKYK
jgi:hypothetical protein